MGRKQRRHLPPEKAKVWRLPVQSVHLQVSCSSVFPPTGFLQFCQCLRHRSNFWLQNPVLLVPFSNEKQKQVTCDVTNICITHAGLNHDVTHRLQNTIIMTACTAFDLDKKRDHKSVEKLRSIIHSVALSWIRPDITAMVDWVLKSIQLSINLMDWAPEFLRLASPLMSHRVKRLQVPHGII